MNTKNLNTQKVPTSIFIFAVVVFIFSGHAQADTELKFEKAIFYGGPGDQTGNAVQFKDGRLYVAGADTVSSSKGLGVSYAVPAVDLPVSNFSWPDSQKSAVSVSTVFADMAASYEGMYFAGSSLVKLSGKKTAQELSGVLAKFPLDATKTSMPLWVVRSGFFPDQKEEALRAVIAVDEKDAAVIYVTGHASSRLNNTTAMLAKYDVKGNLLWAKALGDTDVMKKSGGTALAVLNGYIYVAGFTSSDGKKFTSLPLKASLWKYDSSGNQVWMQSAAPELYALSNADSTTYGIKVDVAVSDNYLYMTSAKKATKDSDGDVLLVKYDENGKLVWENRWIAKSSAGDAAKYSWISGIAAGKERLYVAGYMEYKDKKGDVDSFLIEVDKDYGAVLAVHTYGTPNQLENALEVTVAGTDVYVVGMRKPLVQDQKDPSSNMDLSLLRYMVLPVAKAAIDIEPDSSQNVIVPDATEEQKTDSKKKKAAPPKTKEITAAILSTQEFNAATQVDMHSLTFGRTGHEASWSNCSAKDINQDGSLDLLCSFKPSWTPWKESKSIFQDGDTQGILKGQMLSGARFMGKDVVKIGKVSAPAPQPQTPAPAPAPVSLVSQPPVSEPVTEPASSTTTVAPATSPTTAAPSTTTTVAPATSTTTSLISEPTKPVLLTTTVTPTTSTATDAPVVSEPFIQPATSTTEPTTLASTSSTPVIYQPLATEPAPATSTTQPTSNYQPIYVSQPIATTSPSTASITPTSSTTLTSGTPTSSGSSSPDLYQKSLELFRKMGTLYSSDLDLKSGFKHQEGNFADRPEADQIDPERTGSGTGLGRAYGDLGRKAFQQGKYAEAIAYYQDALKLDPHLPELHTGLGLVLIQQGNLEEAAAHFSEALKLNPDDKTARENLDIILAKLGQSKVKTPEAIPPTA